MSRPKQYADDATRAVAWRQRQQQQQLQDAEIARHTLRLHHILQKAADQGHPQASSLVGKNVSETLKNLQQQFQSQP